MAFPHSRQNERWAGFGAPQAGQSREDRLNTRISFEIAFIGRGASYDRGVSRVPRKTKFDADQTNPALEVTQKLVIDERRIAEKGNDDTTSTALPIIGKLLAKERKRARKKRRT
jgi:hypothetical protein